MIHNIVSVTFYQTITLHEDSINGRKAFNTLDAIALPGVRLDREGESITIYHDDFKYCYCVGMANVRHYRFEKTKEEDEGEDVNILKERKRLLERKKKSKAKKRVVKKKISKKVSKKCTTQKKSS